MKPINRARVMLRIAAWIAAIVLAAAIDRPVVEWVSTTPMPARIEANRHWIELLKLPGEIYVIAPLILVMYVVHPLRWKAAGFMALAMAVASMNGLIKWIIGRTRPFKLYDDRGESMIAPFHFDPFRGGWRGLFFGENLCFPSGHVAMAFAAATALAILWPRARWRWVPFVWAAIVGLERVAANAHWPSDCVAAAALGVGGVQLVHWMAKKISRTADTDVADERLVATRPTGS